MGVFRFPVSNQLSDTAPVAYAFVAHLRTDSCYTSHTFPLTGNRRRLFLTSEPWKMNPRL